MRTLVSLVLAALAVSPLAQTSSPFPLSGNHRDVFVVELEDGSVLAADAFEATVFPDWWAYFESPFFVRNDMRCGQREVLGTPQAGTSDCNSSQTVPQGSYDPQGGVQISIPVVFHVLSHKNGSGNVSDAQIHEQVQVLNEDYRAIAGSLGASGADTRIEFYLADVDPDGNPTNGITRHKSVKWYNDSGNYYSAVGWDTTRYLNIYTNSAGGNLGYAYIPSGGGVAGQSWDGVRLHWATVGNPAPYGSPYHLGRSGSHEVGHYLGLYHTFQGGCTNPSTCYTNGDLICDTNPESSPNYSPCSRTTCGSSDPTDNYMDYSDDICMERFTGDQANRMRCTLMNFRAELGSSGTVNQAPSVTIDAPGDGHTVSDGTPITFQGTATDAEDGDLSGSIAWSSSLDGSLGAGASVTATLSAGTHAVTASATDSGSKSGSDQIAVTVQGAGGGIQLSASTYKVKGYQHADLTWSGAGGAQVDVYRNGNLVETTANDGEFTDNIGVKGGGVSYAYQVCEAGSATCSDTATAGF